VENADRGITCLSYGHNINMSALEIFSAKEAKRRFDCGGKHLGCRVTVHIVTGAGEGLQYGLSGNRAPVFGDTPDEDLMGNRPLGNGGYPRGKSGPT